MIYKSYLIEKDISQLKTNIALFFGVNLGLKNDFKKLIKNANKNSEIIILNQDDVLKNSNLIYNEIRNGSLFTEKKIFFVDDATDKLLTTIEDIENLVSDQKIYLFSDILEKKSKLRNFIEKSNKSSAIACYEDNDITLKNIVQIKLRGFTGLTPKNINLIVENCNLDRAKLNNELEKILIFFDNKNINLEKLEILLNLKTNEDFNKLKDAALLGRKNETNKLLSDTLIDPDKNIFYLNIINQRLLRLLEISDTQNNEIESKVNSLKPPIFWKDKTNFISQAKKWQGEKINKMLKKTYGIERLIKSNSLINKNILIKNLVIDICENANS